MSFIVSFKGQFQPYPLPDLSHYDRVKNVYKAKQAQELKDNHENETPIEGNFEKTKSRHNSQGINAYQKSEKQYQQERIPHQARDIMSTNVRVLSYRASRQEGIEMMDNYEFRHIPVINDEQTLIGIISEKDFLAKPLNGSIETLMSEKVLTCLDTTRLQDIAKIMLHEKLGALPVVNEKHILVGIVTQTDILQFVTRIMSINQLF